jgi:hypothetical protein
LAFILSYHCQLPQGAIRVLSRNFDVSKRKELLVAFRRNGALLDSNVTGGGMNASDLARLHAYPQRNRHLQALIHAKADLLKSADSRDLFPPLLHVSMNVRHAQREGTSIMLFFVVVLALALPGIVESARQESTRC